MKRKLISILLIFALIIGYVPVLTTTVSADTKPVKIIITPNRTNAQENDQVIFTVSLQINETVNSIELDFKVPTGLTYDKESADFNQTFRTNVKQSETVSELSITEQNYSRYARNKYEQNNLAGNEIKIIVVDPDGICVKPDYETTGLVEIATFSATVDQGASGTFTTTIDEAKSSFSKTGSLGNTEEIPFSNIGIDNQAVTVEGSNPEPQEISVTGVAVEEDGLNIDISTTKSVQLHGSVIPGDATNKGLTWESSNEDVATVDANGLVAIKAKGSVVITARSAENSVLFAPCNIYITCGHNGEKDVHSRIEPTCKSEGHEAYTKCLECGDIISGQDTVIAKSDHNYGELIAEVPSVHTQTELQDGTIAHYKCSDCGKYFNEDKVEITEEELAIKAIHKCGDEWITDEDSHWHKCIGCGLIQDLGEHTGGEATCKDKAVCEVCGKEFGELDSNNHKGETEVRNAEDATCTTAGYTGDTYCKDCGEKIADGTVINALGHTGGEATCKNKAVCTRCQNEYGELNKDNHKGETEVRNAEDATCTTAGYTGDTYCKDCGTKIADGTVINALGHTGGEATCKNKAVCTRCQNEYGELNKDNHKGETEVRDAKDATCTEAGYTGDTYCKDCGTKIVEGTVIEALGHTGGTATCVHKAVCTRCNNEYGELDPNNHEHTHIIEKVDATTKTTGTEEAVFCEDENKIVSGGEVIPVKEPEIVVKAEENSNIDETVVDAVKDLLLRIAKGEEVSIDGDTDAIKELVLNEEKGFIVELVLDDVDEKQIAEDKELIEGALKDNSNVVGYYEVEVVIKVDGKEIGTINETNKKMRIVFPIPSDLPEVEEGYTRTFYIIRVHDYNGTKKAEIIPVTVSGNSGIAETDKFSTYTLAYVDEAKPVETTQQEPTTEPAKAPVTGDNFNLALWISILVISGISFVIIGKCKTGKRKEKRSK